MVPAKADLAVARRYIGLVTDRKLAATADHYIAIMLPGRMFKTAFARRDLAPVMLSRTIGASATPTSALVPRNSCGAFRAPTLGVLTFSFLPYTVFNIASPLIAMAMAFAGIRMLTVPRQRPERLLS
jgi:NhaC family Na+:H+ antiporter